MERFSLGFIHFGVSYWRPLNIWRKTLKTSRCRSFSSTWQTHSVVTGLLGLVTATPWILAKWAKASPLSSPPLSSLELPKAPHFPSTSPANRHILPSKYPLDLQTRWSSRTRMLTRMLMVQMSKHMVMQSRTIPFCNSFFEQSCTCFPCYQSAVWSGKCRVWSAECEVTSVECKVWSGERRVCKV